MISLPSVGSEINSVSLQKQAEEDLEIREKLLNGCPPEWPEVTFWGKPEDISQDEKDSYVIAAALSKYHQCSDDGCIMKNQLYFPEARSRKNYYYPVEGYDGTLRIAILVAGGIAPGINAVIDGIVQRHWSDARKNGYKPLIYGITNGISSIVMKPQKASYIRDGALVALAPDENKLAEMGDDLKKRNSTWKFTATHACEGGSIIGTSRVDDLIKNKALLAKVVDALLARRIEILYVIGGDGSMKLAHALWHYANTNPDNANPDPNDLTDDKKMSMEKKLSVIAIPKTMDNDILWVWQSFGFLSAVEKAREILAILDTEIKSNPRLCILQLFGSDSGFVVSHTVAASGSDQCDAALIPEVKFSMSGLAHYLQKRMCDRKMMSPSAIVPSGFLVMSETAIPTDAICYVDREEEIPVDLRSDYQSIKEKNNLRIDLNAIATKINLSREEKDSIYSFHKMRKSGKRIQGQTSDALRSAGLRIVKGCLQELLVIPDKSLERKPQPDWTKLRIVTNEPRHVLRSIDPACSDIVMGQRLGTLAAENAMAGYTDFMISQWLTEYVLVPLPLVVLGRKRIPMDGMFWKSVVAKTGQPDDLDKIDE
jgi:6-phosphofructokinase